MAEGSRVPSYELRGFRAPARGGRPDDPGQTVPRYRQSTWLRRLQPSKRQGFFGRGNSAHRSPPHHPSSTNTGHSSTNTGHSKLAKTSVEERRSVVSKMGSDASKLRGFGSEVYGPPELRTSVVSDLQQDPDAEKPHAEILWETCRVTGASTQPTFLNLVQSRYRAKLHSSHLGSLPFS
jgi:hypothetical protein